MSDAVTSTSILTPTAPRNVNGQTTNGHDSSTTNGNKVNGVSNKAEDTLVRPGETERETESESLEKLLLVAVVVLRQAIDLVDESLSEDAQLTQVSKYIPGSTIGKHLRHATDHFSLLLDSLSTADLNASSTGASQIRQRQREPESEPELLELNYDVRARGTPMESSRASARATLESTIARLQRLVPGAERDRPVRLRAVTPYAQTFRTSFGRELWFGALHAVHHWSMVRVIAGELGIQLEDSFGVAPSTLVHHGSEAPLGKAKI
ncbi:uncharacterized protein FOMMEDRAFT_133608 [Fomitiporia mediterranea MF3/22]|uniref:uncharacterized protein n=1 Tax=Fomitiporia mediterranea (strain MF3/22) TaxID=694068 RepID=UPI000440893C|nr:uncharacterized protein FOMMEDRAFT_133608 [Fomitiporia mediterranea MF3/22]EJD04303.1 hypothetical protein FOMMEDRAFT_133608 [Fomitiporia mediterranea MF3/22]